MPTIKIGDVVVQVPCDLRARIYRRYLEEAKQCFYRYTNFQVSDTNKAKIQVALQDPNLLSCLAKAIDTYVATGVAYDLRKWRYRILHDLPPPEEPPLSTVENPTDVTFLKSPVLEGEDREVEPEGPARLWYQKYFEWFIYRGYVTQTGDGGPTITTGVEAYFLRYPLIRHAAETCTRNFVENIKLACERVCRDAWPQGGEVGAIGQVFFINDRPKSLVKIDPSGSDTHKGGKQVLFLTFQLISDGYGKLVYKPSDVEMDYRLLGNTDGMRNNYDLDNTPSLTELVNPNLNAPKCIPLPTYRILPRNHGSTLEEGDEANPILPIYTSYGYIEFLTHEPPAYEDGKPKPMRQGSAPGDWVTDNEATVRNFYRQWGELIALCSVFSLCDLHRENVIVHNLQPYLIDLENCLAKPIDGFDGGLIDGMTAFTVADRDQPEDASQEGIVNLPLLNPQMKHYRMKPTPNRIWLSRENKSAEPKNYSDDIALGLNIMLRILKVNSAIIREWLESIKDCVARSVIFRTTDYYKRCAWVYFDAKATDPSSASFVDGEWFTKWKEEAESFYGKVLGNESDLGDYGAWPSIKEGDRYTSAAPIYALQTRDNDFQDYTNCDIPSYYHRLDSPDLLNARGQKVNVNIGHICPPLGRITYFPESTWRVVRRQLDGLGNATEYHNRLCRCLDQIKVGLGQNIQ